MSLGFTRYTLVMLAVGAAPWLSHAAPAAAEDTAMEWQFHEASDPDNQGAMTARLVYGVPETDNVQVMGVCDARPGSGAKVSSLTFGANIGDLAAGAAADLRFSGGGYEQTLHGTVARPEGEGVSGVQLDLANDDPLWTAFTEKDTLDYLVPGYRAATLPLAAGRGKLKTFVETCRGYEKAVMGDQTANADETAPDADSAEKAAFDSAKELGTVGAFEAFLSNYGTGFYADLARAYIDKLKQAGPPADAPSPPAPTPKPSVVADPGPDPKCSDRPNLKSKNSDTPTTVTFVNKSGSYRTVLWIDFNGQPKDYGGLNDGERLSQKTFLTHPWMITDGPGNCIEIIMPHAKERVVELTGGNSTATAAPPPKPKAAAAPPKPKATTKCRSRSVLIDGKCILKRNAAGYCGPGYHLKGNKCVSGAYVAPKPKKRSTHGCPPGQVWSAQEGCHYDD